MRNLPDWIDSWIEYRDISEAPRIYDKWTAISMIASALERKVYLRWDKNIYPNFYIVLVGPPSCRKGTAMGPGRDILDELQTINLVADATTKERLAQRMAESTNEYASSDGMTLHKHSSMTLWSEEFTVFLGYGNQEIMPWLCDWYDSRNTWQYQVKHGTDSDVDNVWLNIIGATTPELLQDVLPRESFGSGLNSRIIFIYARKKGKIVLFPFENEENVKLRENLINDLQKINIITGEFKPDQSYLEVWKDWYPNQNNHRFAQDPRMAGYIGRRPTHLHKLAIVKNASRDGKKILTSEDLNWSIKTLEEAEERMLKTFSGIGKSQTAFIMKAISDFIEFQGEVKYSELQSKFKYDANKDETSVVLATLEKAGLVEIERVKTEKGKDIIIKSLL